MTRRHIIGVLALLAISGCAFGPGLPFAVLEPALTVALTVPAGRDAGEGWQRLDNDYQVLFEELEVEVADLVLLETAAAGPISFDPANPPPGYTICHNGHCDREDGALVPYEEVQAELDGGGSGPRTVVTLPAGSFDALAAERRLLGCEPSCDLPLAEISRVRARLTEVKMAGRVRDGRVPARFAGERAWRIRLVPQEPVALDTSTALSASNDAPLYAELEVTAAFSGRQLDGIAWDTATPVGELIDLDVEGNAELRRVVLENVAAMPLDVKVVRPGGHQ